jgi:hypothetical protein
VRSRNGDKFPRFHYSNFVASLRARRSAVAMRSCTYTFLGSGPVRYAQEEWPAKSLVIVGGRGNQGGIHIDRRRRRRVRAIRVGSNVWS